MKPNLNHEKKIVESWRVDEGFRPIPTDIIKVPIKLSAKYPMTEAFIYAQTSKPESWPCIVIQNGVDKTSHGLYCFMHSGHRTECPSITFGFSQSSITISKIEIEKSICYFIAELMRLNTINLGFMYECFVSNNN